jgi:hypothetical protein
MGHFIEDKSKIKQNMDWGSTISSKEKYLGDSGKMIKCMGVEYIFFSMVRNTQAQSKDKLKKVMVNIIIVMVISILGSG